MNRKKRKKPALENSYIRNFFALLCALTVSGLFIEQCLADSWVSKGLDLFIYAFHMPLLIFLTGALFRDIETDSKKIWSAVLYALILYVLMKAVISLVKVYFQEKLAFSLLSESEAPWIFLSIASNFALAHCLRNVGRNILLGISVVLALLCGYTENIGDFLALSRTLIFLPFFLSGWTCGIRRAEHATSRKWIRLLGSGILTLALIISVRYAKWLYFLRPLFTGQDSYTEFGELYPYGPLYRLLAYLISAALLVSILAVTPRKSLGKYIDNIGTSFAQIYLLHCPILYVLVRLGVYDALNCALGRKIGRVAWVGCALICVCVLSISLLNRALSKIVQDIRRLPNHAVSVIFPIDSKKKCVACYTVIFSIAIIFCFYMFYIAEKTVIWKHDGDDFHLPALMVFGTYLRNLVSGIFQGQINFSQFSFNIGYGMDPLLFALPSYADPLNFFSVFVPEIYAEHLYTIILVARLYLIGLSFLAYCFYMKKEYFSSCIATLVYVFCTYTFWTGPRHPYYMTALICLPLLLIGVEETLRKPKISNAFVVAVSISIISNYYLLWMNTIFCVFYFLLRFPEVVSKKWGCFFRSTFSAIGSYLLGLGIGAVSLIPNIFLYLNSNRQGAYPDPSIWPFYRTNYIKRLFGYFITPFERPGNGTIEGFAAISLICVLILFIKVKGHKALKSGLVLTIVALLIPACALAMNAFGVITNRWSYQLALVTAIVVATALDSIPELTKKDFLKLFGGICAYIIYIAFVKITQSIYSLTGIIFLLLTFVCIFIAKEESWCSRKSQTIISFLLLLCIIVSGYMEYSVSYGNYVNEFLSIGQFRKNMNENSPYAALSNVLDEQFYRIDSDEMIRGFINSSVVIGVNSTSFFFNAMDKYLYKYMGELENADMKGNLWFYGLDTRVFPMAISQTKYWVPRTGEFPVPYGYIEVEAEHNNTDYTVYENQNFLPLGFTYDSSITEEDFEDLNAVERQEALMQAVVLDASNESCENDIIFSSSPVPYLVKECDGITEKDGIYRVKKANATLLIEFEERDNAEHYIKFNDFDIDANGSANWQMKITNVGAGYTTDCQVISSLKHTHVLTSNYTVNLGYIEKAGRASYLITFPSKGTFTLDSLEVYAQSMDMYDAYVQKLSENTLKNVEIGLSHVSGTISLNEDKFLYYSIPYSTGWKATVDGNPVEIQRANIAFMAIPLTAGDHEVVLHYSTPGLALGGAASVVSVLILLFICKRRKHCINSGESNA